MQSNSDFEEMLLAFNAANVKYLVIGAFALAAYARPRATGDIDLWVETSAVNARRVFRALASFGAPLEGISETTFTEPNLVFQMGIAPVRIDILTSIDGVSFDDAWPNRTASTIGTVAAYVIGRADLKRNKAATGRPRDLADIERLDSD
jgi:hypothetical protein